MKKETILQRIDYYADKNNLNDNKITVKAGLSVGLLGKSRKSTGGLTSESIEKILYSFPGINPEWLLTGKGEMLKKEENTSSIVSEPDVARYEKTHRILEINYERTIEALRKTIMAQEKTIELLEQTLASERANKSQPQNSTTAPDQSDLHL